MKEKISALMDNALGGEERAAPLNALCEGSEARETWRTYHLIGDALRETRMLSGGFATRVVTRIAAEPTVMAPALRAPAEMRWPALSLAAGLAALSLVIATIYMTQQVTGPVVEVARAPKAVDTPVKETGRSEPKAVAQVAPPDAAHDYLLAHQGSSSRNSLQGVAPYVRMVSGQAVAGKP